MREFKIRLHSVQEVQEFVDLATTKPFNIRVCDYGHQVNGKSFIGMFSLDYRRPVRVRVKCTEEEFGRFRRQAAQFLV